jgi:HlyD family secretion protein
MSQQQQSSADEIISLPGFGEDDGDDQDALAGPVRPRRRRGWIVAGAILLLIILLGALLLRLRSGPPQVTYQYQKVSQGDFSLSVNTTGPLQSGTYNVVFSGTGKIAEIDVTVGETVKKSQVLAKLDKTSLQDAVNTAQAQVLAAQATLNGDQATYSKTQDQSQANVSAAQTTLTNAQDNFSTTQQQSLANVNAAQTSLSDAQTNLAKTKAASNASIAASQTTLNNARINLQHVQAQSQASIATAKVTEEQAIAACNSGTPTPAPDCVQLAEDQYNQAVATANANVATAQNQVTTAQKGLTTAQAQAAANNATAQGQVNTAQSQLNTATAQGNTSNTTAQGQINTAQSQLNTALAQANTNNATALNTITTAQGQVNADLAQLQTAQHNLNNATLTAPHDGIVTTINGTVGGTPGAPVNSSSTPTSGVSGSTFVQIVDISTLQVLANVNESDTGNLKVGEPAQFTVSAYGQRVFHGTVSAISPNGQTVSNVVTYPVTIDIDMKALNGAILFPDMTANVTIIVAQRSHVLLIPASAVNFARTAINAANSRRALISKDQANSALDQARQMLQGLSNEKPDIVNDNPIPAYVLEQVNGQFIVKPVVLGLTDGIVYEVLAGLAPNEAFVVGSTGG